MINGDKQEKLQFDWKRLIPHISKQFWTKIFVSVGALIAALLAIFVNAIADVLEGISSGNPVDYGIFITVIKLVTVPLIFFVYFKRYLANEDKIWTEKIEVLEKAHKDEIDDLRKKYEEEVATHRQCDEEKNKRIAELEARLTTVETEKKIAKIEADLALERKIHEAKIESAELRGALSVKNEEIERANNRYKDLKTQYDLRMGVTNGNGNKS